MTRAEAAENLKYGKVSVKVWESGWRSKVVRGEKIIRVGDALLKFVDGQVAGVRGRCVFDTFRWFCIVLHSCSTFDI